jgi:hypothetical protein
MTRGLCGYAVGWIRRISQKATADTNAAAGMVKAQAQTILVATPQRTAESLWVAPTPTIAPVIVCVVLTGMPAKAVANKVIAPAVSAQNPPTGLSLVILDPMVWTMRHPPK